MRSSGNNHDFWTSVDGTFFTWADNTGFGYAGYMFMEGGKVVRQVLDIDTIYIPGMHNVENYMAAIAAVDGLVPEEIIVRFAKSFGG